MKRKWRGHRHGTAPVDVDVGAAAAEESPFAAVLVLIGGGMGGFMVSLLVSFVCGIAIATDGAVWLWCPQSAGGRVTTVLMCVRNLD